MKKIIIATVTMFTAIAFSAYTNGSARPVIKLNNVEIKATRQLNTEAPTTIGRADLGQAD